MGVNLPLQLTRFVGREAELAHVCQLLGVDRLVTLTGSGGVGKTRLAIETARRIQDSCRNGVWLVELGSLTEDALVFQAVAEPLGLRAEAQSSLQQTILEFLRPRQLVLVLDNCEHLIGACASLADTLLRACPDLRILATSREPLHVPGEIAWRVPCLSLPALSALLSPQHVLESEAADCSSTGRRQLMGSRCPKATRKPSRGCVTAWTASHLPSSLPPPGRDLCRSSKS